MAITALATALSAVLVVVDIGSKSLWFDEAYSVGLVDRPLGDALWRIGNWELNQSPFYAVLLAWQRLGEGDAFLRLPAAAFAVATVPATYAVGRRVFDPWVGAIAAAVVAGHALVVQWGQQVRGYSLAVLLATVATLLLLRALERPTTARVVAYGVVAGVACYTHVVTALVVAAHAVTVLTTRPVPWRAIRTAVGTGAVVTAPLAWYLVTRSGDPLDWIGDPTRAEVVDELADVAGGGVRHLAVVGGLAAVGATIAAASRRWQSRLVALWAAVPVAVVVVSTYTVKPLLVARFLVVVVPALALLVGLAVRRLPRAAGVVAVAALAVVSAQGVRDWYAVGSFEDWRGAVASVEASAGPDDDVVVVPGRAVHAVHHYGPALRTVSPSDLDDAGGDRLWLLARRSQLGTEWPVPEGFDDEIARAYVLVETRRFTNIDVLLFERR